MFPDSRSKGLRTVGRLRFQSFGIKLIEHSFGRTELDRMLTVKCRAFLFVKRMLWVSYEVFLYLGIENIQPIMPVFMLVGTTL